MAEEGLTGFFASQEGTIGFCGDQSAFSSEDLLALDSEGRAVITQHKFKGAEGSETLTVINVYCPRADPEKPERKLFKQQFYRLLQNRAEAVLGPQSHVIVLGDINTSHRPIDHCDPNDVDNFEDNPSRKWLDGFLFRPMVNGNCDGEDDFESSQECAPGGKFVDTFRHFHPTRPDAFTCWSTLTGARQTNYGTRIDYIFASRSLVATSLLNADIMPEVDGSDHCPVWAQLSCTPIPSSRCPALCTRYMPEFAGRQQKLSRFLVKVYEQPEVSRDTLPGSQEAGEITENLSPLAEGITTRKRPSDGLPESTAFKGKRGKHVKMAPKPQGSLLAFFKPKNSVVPSYEKSLKSESSRHDTHHKVMQTHVKDCNATLSMPQQRHTEDKHETNNFRVTKTKTEGSCGQDQSQCIATVHQESRDKKGMCPDFWKAVLHGPPQPPLCKVHSEPCVLRTVKKAGPNMGRQFFVCARPQGHASNPQARCNFFAWVEKGK